MDSPPPRTILRKELTALPLTEEERKRLVKPEYAADDSSEWGRVLDQDATPELELGLVDNADGSARLAVGEALALAAVFGPSPTRGSAVSEDGLQIDVRIECTPDASTDNKAARNQKTYQELIGEILRHTVRCDRYARCGLMLSLRCLKGDGAVLPCLINASVAAIMDAGVEMKVLPVAVGFEFQRREGAEVTREMAANTEATIVVGEQDMVYGVHITGYTGDTDGSRIEQALNASWSAAASFSEIYRSSARARAAASDGPTPKVSRLG